jgi:hypothetical protein
MHVLDNCYLSSTEQNLQHSVLLEAGPGKRAACFIEAQPRQLCLSQAQIGQGHRSRREHGSYRGPPCRLADC